MVSINPEQIDAAQALTGAYDLDQSALRTLSIGGNLVPERFDELALSYYEEGPGAGQLETVTYKLGGTTIAVLTFGYDLSTNLISVVRS